MVRIAYVNNTNQNVVDFHAAIMGAIAAGGVFPTDEFSGNLGEVFRLRSVMVGPDIRWILEMA